MTHETRTIISVVIAAPAFVCFGAAAWLRATSDRLAASPDAAASIEAGESLDEHYIPEAELLSPEGQALRSKANRLAKLGLALFALALLNHLTT
jgi:hypothetical protein